MQAESPEPFRQIVREERHFCAVLAGLLWQRGPNFANFVDLLNRRLPPGAQVTTMALDEAELFVEFNMLRDRWYAHPKEGRKDYLVHMMRGIPELRAVAEELPSSISGLNARFIGDRGQNMTSAVAYPGHWSVKALRKFAGPDTSLFRMLCYFKWSFNIKPDLVILFPDARVICIEAKLESDASTYPATAEEKSLFDEAFGSNKYRVGQLELQRFMFDKVLRMSCSFAVIGRKPAKFVREPSSTFVTWREVFEQLDLSHSVPSVTRLIKENRYLVQSHDPR